MEATLTPSRSTRATKYYYRKLLDGKFHKMRRRKYRFKLGEEEKVARSILAHAREKDWCAVCRVVTDEKTGEAYVEVWGDMALRYKDLPPPEIEKQLRQAGYDIRKRRHLDST